MRARVTFDGRSVEVELHHPHPGLDAPGELCVQKLNVVTEGGVVTLPLLERRRFRLERRGEDGVHEYVEASEPAEPGVVLAGGTLDGEWLPRNYTTYCAALDDGGWEIYELTEERTADGLPILRVRDYPAGGNGSLP